MNDLKEILNEFLKASFKDNVYWYVKSIWWYHVGYVFLAFIFPIAYSIKLKRWLLK